MQAGALLESEPKRSKLLNLVYTRLLVHGYSHFAIKSLASEVQLLHWLLSQATVWLLVCISQPIKQKEKENRQDTEKPKFLRFLFKVTFRILILTSTAESW